MNSIVRFQRVICRFIRQVGGGVDVYSLSQRIGSEPEINNLLGLHRVLLKSGVRNIVRAYNMVKLSDFKNIPLLLYTKSEILLVHFKKKTSNLIVYNGERKLKMNLEDLDEASYWIIPVEVAPYMTKSPLEKRRICVLFTMTLLPLLLLLFSINFFLNDISLSNLFFYNLFSNIIVPIFGSLICVKIIRIENNTAEAGMLCAAFAKNKWVGCNLKNQQTTFYSFFKWSILGLSHFIAVIIAYILKSTPIIEPYISIPLYLLVIVVSLYTQAIINKRFCIYCCFVVIVLIIRIICLLGVVSPISTISFSFVEINKILFYCLSTICIFIPLQILDINNMQGKNLKKQGALLNALKYGESVFDVIHRQPEIGQYNMESNSVGISFGGGDRELVIVTSPSCKHCDKLMKKLSFFCEDIKMKISFVYLARKKEDESTILNLISYYQRTAPTIRQYIDAMGSIPILESGHNNMVLQEFAKHKVFCEQNKIDAIPTIFVNNNKLNNAYELEDLLFV